MTAKYKSCRASKVFNRNDLLYSSNVETCTHLNKDFQFLVKQHSNTVVRLQQQTMSKWRLCTYINQVSQHISITMSERADNLCLLRWWGDQRCPLTTPLQGSLHYLGIQFYDTDECTHISIIIIFFVILQQNTWVNLSFTKCSLQYPNKSLSLHYVRQP